MLIEFRVGNYRSFKEIVTFSMVASSINANDEKIDENNVFKIDDELSLLKSAAIYGANASGKSNLAAAINFMRWFVLNSSKETQVAEKIDVEEFRLSTETEKKPSFFEIVFLLGKKIYRYGFEVDTDRVFSEWLFHVPKVKEAKLFERKTDRIKVFKTFIEGTEIENKTRRNALFLSVVAQFNGRISQQILLWFSRSLNAISGLHDDLYRQSTRDYLANNQYREDIIQFIKKLDLSIDDIQIDNNSLTDELLQGVPENLRPFILSSRTARKTIKTLHRKYDAEGKQISLEKFDLDKHESQGTKKMFALAGHILDTLRNGKVLLLDELDTSLHPLISCAIINLFNSNQTNPNAQLIFMTHDTNLLSNNIFRRDRIWFAEKDRQGATHLYSLVEYKLENDAAIVSDYIRGRYGAIPFIGDLQRLISQHND